MTSKNVVFDVVGTLSSYSNFFDVSVMRKCPLLLAFSANAMKAIDITLGERLRAEGVSIQALGFLWIEVTGREYTNLSMNGLYTPSSTLFKSLFWRILFQAGIAEPLKFATDDNLAALLKAYSDMEMRPGAKECVEKLRNAGWTVWGLTTGDADTVRGYFLRSGIDMPAENVKSCNELRITKPEPDAYKPMLKQLSGDGSRPFFAAAHAWDSAAAREVG